MAASISIEVSYYIPSVSGVPLLGKQFGEFEREQNNHGGGGPRKTNKSLNSFRAVSQLNERRMGYRSFNPEREIASIFDLWLGAKRLGAN